MPGLAGRELTEAWETAVAGSGLPLYQPVGRARGRVAFGAPLAADIAAERELADIVLTDLLPVWQVREAVSRCAPPGWRLVDLFDVWLGERSLAGQVVAADYRIELDGADASVVTAAAAALMAAVRLPRERQKGGGNVAYDLRPLIVRVTASSTDASVVVHARTRFDPVRGTGRPDEVVAALGDLGGTPLATASIVRERLLLADDPA